MLSYEIVIHRTINKADVHREKYYKSVTYRRQKAYFIFLEIAQKIHGHLKIRLKKSSNEIK